MEHGTPTVTMETREDPRFVQFAKGEVVSGVLLSIQSFRIGDKPCVRYVVKEDSGERVSFIGTYQINQKLRPSDPGHRISVECTGEDEAVKRGENCMKTFIVKVSSSLVLNVTPVSDLGISNADIPF